MRAKNSPMFIRTLLDWSAPPPANPTADGETGKEKVGNTLLVKIRDICMENEALSATLKQKEYANKIKLMRKNGHLLVTLLLANMTTNELCPSSRTPSSAAVSRLSSSVPRSSSCLALPCLFPQVSHIYQGLSITSTFVCVELSYASSESEPKPQKFKIPGGAVVRCRRSAPHVAASSSTWRQRRSGYLRTEYFDDADADADVDTDLLEVVKVNSSNGDEYLREGCN
ncbi:uncharacterized protein C8Q71DRAFT_862304 [Rhodofomes roseus]|uniref:Uncharacterized protein n=1 Tax=Rhodofomes roseus TaxID=34475 RepID=A0ABQ8K1G4_9APHY|nr:uncharacterized protein C8Q71DRAFT_862304 [Rhodofomes roseus]KAH9830556.1 hypothetical protein C8Q71DRAFT_862304 [Rhodofomes roseus]